MKKVVIVDSVRTASTLVNEPADYLGSHVIKHPIQQVQLMKLFSVKRSKV